MKILLTSNPCTVRFIEVLTFKENTGTSLLSWVTTITVTFALAETSMPIEKWRARNEMSLYVKNTKTKSKCEAYLSGWYVRLDIDLRQFVAGMPCWDTLNTVVESWFQIETYLDELGMRAAGQSSSACIGVSHFHIMNIPDYYLYLNI